MKADIESYEWGTLPNLFSSGVLRYVRQFNLETHHGVDTVGETLITRLGYLRTLYDEGFRLYASNPNRAITNMATSSNTNRIVSAANEIYFVNINVKK